MTYETFYRAKDIINEVANLQFVKEKADYSHHTPLDSQALVLMFDRIHMYDENLYKSIMKNISERLEARLFELNIELQAI